MQLYTASALLKGVKTELIKAIDQVPSPRMLTECASIVDSNSDQENFAWIAESPAMTELGDDGEVRFDAPSDATYSLVNATYAGGLAIKRTDIDDDQSMAIKGRIQKLAQMPAMLQSRLLTDALVNGASNTCYTGEAFFASHAARGQQTAAQSNLVTQTGTTTALVTDDIASAREAMMGFLGENNEPVSEDMSSIAIVYPPALDRQVREATRATIIGNTSNVALDELSVSLIPNARLTGTAFYVLNTSGAFKPLILQDRDPFELTSQEADSDSGFRREQYLYKVRWRGVVGYSGWQLAARVA